MEYRKKPSEKNHLILRAAWDAGHSHVWNELIKYTFKHYQSWD